MTEEQRVYFEKLEKQLEPIMNDLAKTHTKNDTIRIEYPVGDIEIHFKE